MTRLQQLEGRVGNLEKALNDIVIVLNGLLEVIYEPEFTGKLDKLAEHGEEETER